MSQILIFHTSKQPPKSPYRGITKYAYENKLPIANAYNNITSRGL